MRRKRKAVMPSSGIDFKPSATASLSGLPADLVEKVLSFAYTGVPKASEASRQIGLFGVNKGLTTITDSWLILNQVAWLREHHPQLTTEKTLIHFMLTSAQPALPVDSKATAAVEPHDSLANAEIEDLSVMNVRINDAEPSLADLSPPLMTAIEAYLHHHYGAAHAYQLKVTYSQVLVEVQLNHFYVYWDEKAQQVFYAIRKSAEAEPERLPILPQELGTFGKDIVMSLMGGGLRPLELQETSLLMTLMVQKGYPAQVLKDDKVIDELAQHFLTWYEKWIYEPFAQWNADGPLLKGGKALRDVFFDSPANLKQAWQAFQVLWDQQAATFRQVFVEEKQSQSSSSPSLPEDSKTHSTSEPTEKLNRSQVVALNQLLIYAQDFTALLHDVVAILAMRHVFSRQATLCPDEIRALFTPEIRIASAYRGTTIRTIAAYLYLRSDYYSAEERLTYLLTHHAYLFKELKSREIILLVRHVQKKSKKMMKGIIHLPIVREKFTAKDYGELAFDSWSARILLEDDLVLAKLTASAQASEDLAKEPFLKVLIELSVFLEDALFEEPLFSRLSPHIHGELWYRLALGNVKNYLPHIVRIAAIRDKLSAHQLLDLIDRVIGMPAEIIPQEGVVERLMAAFESDEDRIKVIKTYEHDLVSPEPIFQPAFLARINSYLSGEVWYLLGNEDESLLPHIIENPVINAKMTARQLFKLIDKAMLFQKTPAVISLLNQPGVIEKFDTREFLEPERRQLNSFYSERAGSQCNAERSIRLLQLVTHPNYSDEKYVAATVTASYIAASQPPSLRSRQPRLDSEHAVADREDVKKGGDVSVAASAVSVSTTSLITAAETSLKPLFMAHGIEDEWLNQFWMGIRTVVLTSQNLRGENPQKESNRLSFLIYQKMIDAILDHLIEAKEAGNKSWVRCLEKVLDQALAAVPVLHENTGDFMQQQYEQVKAQLNPFISNLADEVFSQGATAVIAACDKIAEKEAGKDKTNEERARTYCQLATTARLTHQALTAQDKIAAGKRLRAYGESIRGRVSIGWQILGGVLVVVGAAIATVGVLIAIATIKTGIGALFGALIAGGGGALMGVGIGLFRYGRRKGPAKAVDQVAAELQTPQFVN